MLEKINHSPLISIILPVYNGERYLSRSIISCLNQTYPNIELIIINDASTDSSLQIAENFASQDNRVKIITNEKNKNLPSSLNIGHEFSRGEYITWTSDDNYFSALAIETLFQEIEKQKADIVFSNFKIVDEKGVEIGSYIYDSNNIILLDNIIRACFLYKKKIYKKNNGYDEDLFKIEDYAFWLNASKFAVITHIPQFLYYYRNHPNSLTAQKTISYFKYESDYLHRCKNMYERFFKSFDIDRIDSISDLFYKLHLHQEIKIESLVKNFATYRNILKPVLIQYGEQKNLMEIDRRIRYNIQRFPANQNFKTLLSILRYRPRLLFYYSKRRTLRILYLMTLNKIKI